MEKKNKILIVDDEADILEVLKARMEADNFDVITASNGEEALKKFAKDSPSAVLLDIMMPGLNGMEVLEKIRKDNPHLPVFITTAFSSEERFRMANKLNATGFILKSGSIKEQLAGIKEAIELSEKYK